MSSLILYMEMADAHANPKAKLVTRVPNMTLFSFSSRGDRRPWTGRRTRLGVLARATFGESAASARNSVGRGAKASSEVTRPRRGAPRGGFRSSHEPAGEKYFSTVVAPRARRLDTRGVPPTRRRHNGAPAERAKAYRRCRRCRRSRTGRVLGWRAPRRASRRVGAPKPPRCYPGVGLAPIPRRPRHAVDRPRWSCVRAGFGTSPNASARSTGSPPHL